ncbi:hypothetical protein FPV67DRAFT_268108 [Lyophyllum atratum]|nr:hypothetical protein FPV67DRAFT_268108 [Lyophyllum atratum]
MLPHDRSTESMLALLQRLRSNSLSASRAFKPAGARRLATWTPRALISISIRLRKTGKKAVHGLNSGSPGLAFSEASRRYMPRVLYGRSSQLVYDYNWLPPECSTFRVVRSRRPYGSVTPVYLLLDHEAHEETHGNLHWQGSEKLSGDVLRVDPCYLCAIQHGMSVYCSPTNYTYVTYALPRTFCQVISNRNSSLRSLESFPPPPKRTFTKDL